MDDHELTRLPPVWYPHPDYIRGSYIERLMRAMNIPLDPSHPETAYHEFYRRSIEDPDSFWRRTVEHLGIEWFEPFGAVADMSGGVQWPRWFPGGKLNLTRNAVFRHVKGPRANQPALIWEGEDGAVVRLTYAELAREIGRAAGALNQLGIGKGDRVGLFLPMLPETVIAALAIAYLGAIFVPIFSGYGAEAAAVRLRDSSARLLITADAFYRRGQSVPLGESARHAAAGSVSV